MINYASEHAKKDAKQEKEHAANAKWQNPSIHPSTDRNDVHSSMVLVVLVGDSLNWNGVEETVSHVSQSMLLTSIGVVL